MKKFFKIFIAASFGCIAFTACNNDPAEPLNYNTYQTATVKGKVLVNTDYTLSINAQKWSAAPAGIRIIAEVSNTSITGQSTAGTYRTNAAYNATTGEYTVTVPVSYNGSIVTITVKDWTGKVKDEVYDATAGENVPKEFDALWHSDYTQTTSLKPGDISIDHNIFFEGEGSYGGGYSKLDVGVGTSVY
jgi:hypothetical protein